MRGYKITAPSGAFRFAGSQTEARQHKEAFANDAGTTVRKMEFKESEIDIPTGKADLIPFLNELARSADPDEPRALVGDRPED